MELLITFTSEDGREPLRLHSQSPMIVLRGFNYMGVRDASSPGELVGEQIYGATEIDKIEVFGHPPPPEPQPQPEMVDYVVTPRSFFGQPDPTDPEETESVTLRVRKPPEPEKVKKG
jgi:hypothetical protein